MLDWLAKAFAGTIIEAFINAIAGAVRLRRLDRERDDAIDGRARAEQRQADLEARLKTQKEMADAQIRAPSDRGALADRLRAEAASETTDNILPGSRVPVMDRRDEGPQG